MCFSSLCCLSKLLCSVFDTGAPNSVHGAWKTSSVFWEDDIDGPDVINNMPVWHAQCQLTHLVMQPHITANTVWKARRYSREERLLPHNTWCCQECSMFAMCVRFIQLIFYAQKHIGQRFPSKCLTGWSASKGVKTASAGQACSRTPFLKGRFKALCESACSRFSSVLFDRSAVKLHL